MSVRKLLEKFFPATFSEMFEKNTKTDIVPMYAILPNNWCPYVQDHEKFLLHCQYLDGPKKSQKIILLHALFLKSAQLSFTIPY